MKKKNFHHINPVLPVKDLDETISYYKEKLGFYNEWKWGVNDAGVERDELRVIFNKNVSHASKINNDRQHFELMIFVQSIDAIYEELKSKDITIISELQNEPWGLREFTVEDINGYYLRIAEGIEKNELPMD